jgi:hypothetical protein
MDMMYVPPQPKVVNPAFYYVLMVPTVIFSVISVFFLPIDIAAIKMSLDPGFTVFFILVILVFIIKMLNLLWFYLMLVQAEKLKTSLFNTIVLSLGTLFVGGSLAVVAVEIYLLTNSFLAVLSHPFVMDFGLFFICNICAHLANCLADDKMTYEYLPVPQRQMFYPVDAPVEMKEMPVQPTPVQIQYPELPIQVPMEPIYPELNMPIQYFQTPPKKVEAPKAPAPSRAFIPYYIPK